jgi:hypothetical protein
VTARVFHVTNERLALGRNGRHHPDGGREQGREHDS